MPMYNLIEYSNKYSKTSATLWQYYRYKLVSDNIGNIVNFASNRTLSKYKVKITEKTLI